MRKILIVAQSEFATLVRSKAFMVSILLMPVIMVLSVGADARDEERHRRQGPDVRGRGLHRRPRRAARRGRPGPERGLRRSRRSAGAADDAALHPASKSSRAAGTPEHCGSSSPIASAAKSCSRLSSCPTDLLDPAGKAQIRYYSDHPSYNALPMLAAGDRERDRPERAVPAGLDRSRAGGAAHAARRRSRTSACSSATSAGTVEAGRGSRPGSRPGRAAGDARPDVHHRDVERAAAPQQRHRGEDEPHQRGPDGRDHAVPADDGEADRQRRGLGAACRHLHRRRPRGRAVLGRLRQRRDAGQRSPGSRCSS